MRGRPAPVRDGAAGGAGRRRGWDDAAGAGRCWAAGRCRGGSAPPGPGGGEMGCASGAGRWLCPAEPVERPRDSHTAAAFVVSADVGSPTAHPRDRGAQCVPLVAPIPSSAALSAASPLRSPRIAPPGTEPRLPTPNSPFQGHPGPILTPSASPARQRTRRCCPVGMRPQIPPQPHHSE